MNKMALLSVTGHNFHSRRQFPKMVSSPIMPRLLQFVAVDASLRKRVLCSSIWTCGCGNAGDLSLAESFCRIGFAVAVLMGCLSPEAAKSDVIKLQNGGEVRGVVRFPNSKNKEESPQDAVVIETLSGGEVVILATDISFVTKRPRIVEEYESLARHVVNSVEAHWQLSEWCRQHGLGEPRKEQLQRILELDPEHKQARYGLGHRRQDNRWVSPDEIEAELLETGFVKHKGRIISTLERDRLTTDESRLASQNLWRPKIRLWHGWLLGRDARKQGDALAKFRELHDADAVPALVDFMLGDPKADVRRLAIETLSQIDGDAAVFALARAALGDADYQLRNIAFEALSESQRKTAAPIFERALKDEANGVVQRAAVLLSRIGSRAAVPALIVALATSHKVRVPMQQGIATGFQRDGSAATQSGLPLDVQEAMRAGQLPYGVSVQQSGGVQPSVKWVTIRRPQQNSEVLQALRTLTEKDFGYDQRAWRIWWQSQTQ